jgi:hypothetical protein
VNAIVLPEIKATSHSLAELMRACPLRAGLSRCRAVSAFVLGNPKGWLGTAYHEVLEKIGRADFDPASKQSYVDQLWDAAIAKQHTRAMAHPLDRRFGAPLTWPGYYLAKSAVHLRANELDARAAPVTGGNESASSNVAAIREEEFTAYNGKLRGWPDVVQATEIIDYKTGTLVEFDDTTQTEVVKAAYVRQLRIYGYLVHEALGRWPPRGILLPIVGAGVQVALESAECEREATEAVALLDAYNAALHASSRAQDLASAAPTSCKWCPFKMICPAFWQNATPAWSGQLDGAAVEGVLREPPRSILSGAAIAISIDVVAGTESEQHAEIAPLNPIVHPSAAKLLTGDRIRLVGLRVRQDGKLIPTLRSVLERVTDLPMIDVQSARDGGVPTSDAQTG